MSARSVVAVAVALLGLSACDYTGPDPFAIDSGLWACGASGIDHAADYSRVDSDPVAGSLTAVRSGGCNGGEISARLENWTQLVYLADSSQYPAVVWACSPSNHQLALSAPSLFGFAVNLSLECRRTISSSGQRYPNVGWYASVSHHTAWIYGTQHSTVGGFPQASPWRWVDLCPLSS